MPATYRGSHISFNGFDFNAAGLIITNPAGPGHLPALRGQDVPYAGIPGALFVPKVHDVRAVTFDFVVPNVNQKALGWPGIQGMLDILAQLFGDTQQHPLTFYGADDGMPRTAMAAATQWQPLDKDSSGYVYLGTVTFVLTDPYFYGPQIDIKQSFASALSIAVTNPGTVSVRKMQLYFTGPCTDPEVTNTTNGVSVSIDDTVASGHPLEIDCASWAVYNGGAWDIGALSHLGDTAFMRLDPGLNQLQVSAASYGAGSFELVFSPAYL